MSLPKKKILIVSNIVIAGILMFSTIPSMAAEITWKKIIDYGNPGYSETSSNWTTYNSPQAYNSSYRYLSREVGDGTRQGTATWETTIPYCGIYRVSVSFRRTENRSPDADYYVTKSPGTVTSDYDHYVIDQRSSTPVFDWELGQVDYYYQAGETVRVFLDGTDDSWSDCADAASWELIEWKKCPPSQEEIKAGSAAASRSLLLNN